MFRQDDGDLRRVAHHPSFRCLLDRRAGRLNMLDHALKLAGAGQHDREVLQAKRMGRAGGMPSPSSRNSASTSSGSRPLPTLPSA
jgi:hypothetical protein